MDERTVKTLWRSQESNMSVMTLASVHARAEQFQKKTRRAFVIECITTAFVVVVFGIYSWIFPGWMMKTGSLLCLLAILFALWQVRRRITARQVQAAPARELIAFHRSELVRRRDALKSAWLWYLAPILPGTVLMLMGRWFQFHVPGRSLAQDHAMILSGGAIAALIFAAIWLRQFIRARQLQREIDALDALSGE